MTEKCNTLFLFVIEICLEKLFHGNKIIFIVILLLLYYTERLRW